MIRETHNADGSNLGLGVPATVLGSLGMTKSGNWPGPGLALLPGLLVTHYCYRLQPQRYLVPRYQAIIGNSVHVHHHSKLVPRS